jgi:hypothetical protein
MFVDSYGNPIKKTEQREKVHAQIKDALGNQKLIILNFDECPYTENLNQQLAKQGQVDSSNPKN